MDLGSFLAQYLVNKTYPVLEINPLSTDRARRYTIARINLIQWML